VVGFAFPITRDHQITRSFLIRVHQWSGFAFPITDQMLP
jgi:hypothetical protein